MKQSEIKIGNVYMVKVSGAVVPLRVTGMEFYDETSPGFRISWFCRNLITGRLIHIRSAQRFRREAVEAELAGLK